jgi:predicted SpoU family rRNA methylase
MALKLNATDTHTVLTALQIYREEVLVEGEPNKWKLEQIERLIKSYRRSFSVLARLDKL